VNRGKTRRTRPFWSASRYGLLPGGHAKAIFENTPIGTEQASVRCTQRITDFGLLDVVRVAGHRRARIDLGAVLTSANYAIWIW
jgi:hypothetical protein